LWYADQVQMIQKNVVWLIRVSRPRFWLYLLGPIWLSVIATTSPTRPLPTILTEHGLVLALLGLFFLFPANLFLYGINDLSDADTDQHNQKKGNQEVLLQKKQRHQLIWIVSLSAGLGVFLVLWITRLQPFAAIPLLLWFFLSYAYSAPPFRFKAKPFIDAYSNLLYWLPAASIYFVVTGNWFSWQIIIAATAWTTAMHAFSAVPDIVPDKKAGLQTTAVVLGQRKALLFCVVHWAIFSGIVGWYAPIFGVGSLAYVILAISPLLVSALPVEKVYWAFPRVTAILGFLAWWYLALTKGGLGLS